ncbi:pyridine nucleotide-disulfide oxidoreductase [Planctomycetales bacterium]|nr:pyridine nucleotide-disulfide oxidoreductase [Planctomycetales bacterium]
MRRVVIIGAGFGGLSAAMELDKYSEFEVILIDRNNYHTFLPLLYQVAAAELASEDITSPLRGLLRKNKNVSVMMCEVRQIDFNEKILHTDGPNIRYDYLVLAIGSITNFFGTKGAEQFSFTLKSLEDAVRLRSRILGCLEEASLYSDEHPTVYPSVSELEKKERSAALTNIIIVGGGANGVEFAGALIELIRTSIYKDFPELEKGSVRVTLLESAPILLTGFPQVLCEYTKKRLEKMGVEVKTNAAVKEVKEDGVLLGDGSFLPAATVVWTAGVKAAELIASTGLPTGRSGRINVLPTLQLEKYPEVFAAGDAGLPDGMNVPMVAPNAIQQGIHTAKNLLNLVRGKPLIPFSYHDKGSMAVVGRGAAVVRVGKRTLTGWTAWVLWLFVHLNYLVGFHNRIMVMLNWAWDYFYAERAERLIFKRNDK